MTVLHIFGDSWAAENSELEKLYSGGKIDSPPQSFARLTAELCGLQYLCHARGGASQADMFLQLQHSKIQSQDVAVFLLTSPSRRTYFDDQGKQFTISVDLQKQYVNDHQDSWLSSLHCFAMQQFCLSNNVTPLFVSTFNVNYVELCSLWEHIPKHHWILPPTTCMVRELFDPEWFGQYDIYRNNDFYDWLHSQSPGVQKYIRPCNDHPNMAAREVMASVVASAILKTIPQ
jgi:hypothetical protein